MDASDSPTLAGLAAATSFLLMVATATFGLTDVLCGSDGGFGELCLASVAAVSFAFFLTAPSVA